MKGTTPMDKAMVEELESKHAALHALIEEEEHRTHPDEDLLHRLKKEKLRLKDELAGHMTSADGVFGAATDQPPHRLSFNGRARHARCARGAPAPPASWSRSVVLRAGR